MVIIRVLWLCGMGERFLYSSDKCKTKNYNSENHENLEDKIEITTTERYNSKRNTTAKKSHLLLLKGE